MSTQIEPTAGEENLNKPAGDAPAEGAAHVAAPAPVEEGANAKPVEGGEGAGEPGAEGAPAGEGAGEGEGAAGPEGGAEVAPTTAEIVSMLREQNAALHARLDKIERGEMDDPDAADVEAEKSVLLPQFDDQTFAHFEEKYGLNKTQTHAIRGLVNTVAKNILKHVSGQTAGYRQDQTIGAMASEKSEKGSLKFPGINTPAYREAINEFLGDFNPGVRGDRKLLERAYYYAAGKNAGKAVAAVRTNKEANRVIAGKTRPAAGVGGAAPARPSVTLTPSMKIAARMHPGGEAGYIKDLERRGKSGSVTLEKAV